MTRLDKAFTLFDQYNQQDTHTLHWNGVAYPYTYFYSLQVHDWVKRLAGNASETLLLASRSQHIGRWQIPREQYPKTKAGYLSWRTHLAQFHAIKAGELMQEAGYTDAEIAAVQRIIRKENLRTDEEVQVMENALCLVFLQWQFEDFLEQHDRQKVIRIVQKTWRKMSEPGRAAALTLPYNEKGKALLQEALEG